MPRSSAHPAVRFFLVFILLGALAVAPAGAIVRPAEKPQQLGFRHPDLIASTDARSLDRLPAPLAERLREDLKNVARRESGGPRVLAAPEVADHAGFYDLRAGRWDTLVLSRPLIPGSGAGNDLTWGGLRIESPAGDAQLKKTVVGALAAYLSEHARELGIDAAELGPANVSIAEKGRLIQLYEPRVVDGVPVRDSYVQAVLNGGNLVLLGSRSWGKIDVSRQPSLSAPDAVTAIERYLDSKKVTGVAGWWREPSLTIVPTVRAADPENTPVGEGYRFRLAWIVSPRIEGDLGSWEGLIDAHTGELLSFTDQNQYVQRRVLGGINPVSNDGRSPGGVPDGVEQPNHPMPSADVTLPDGTVLHTNSAGLVDANGPFTVNLAGPYVRINDACGPAAEMADQCTNLNLSSGPGTDCAVPEGHGIGDTHSGRTGFYELNRQIELATAELPSTAVADSPAGYLHRQLTANMNIDNTCNAFWSPTDMTVNFYREGPSASGSVICGNTGEIAAVFDHEWGHGLDTNDNFPGVTSPGEAYADITALVRLNQSCMARGFFKSRGDGTQRNQVFCNDFGDRCTECTGVREDDYKKHQSGQPHDIDWVLGVNPAIPNAGCAVPEELPMPGLQSGPCGFETHCEGVIVGETIWDLMKRDLPCNGVGWEDVNGGQCAGGAAPTIDLNSALEIAARDFYLASGGVNRWYSCNPLAAAGGNEFGGCLADSGYMQFLAADDDNGLLLDGTPHMKAIYDAFNRHNLACNLPVAPANSGCSGKPTAAPVVHAVPTVNGASVTWNAVAGAEKYWVFRTEGVHGCNFGKVKVGEPTGTSFSETGLLDGFQYFYSVMPVGNGLLPGEDACPGPMSDCAAVTPTSPAAPPAAPSLRAGPVSNSLTVSGGDGDASLDNCETGTLSFRVWSDGNAPLTNVRIVEITSPSHPQTTIVTPLPSVVASSLAAGCGLPAATATGTFRFVAHGLAHGDTLTLQVKVTSDQTAPAVETFSMSVTGVESDVVNQPTVTFTFESGTDGWEVHGGSFTRTDTGGGAGGTAWYMASSAAVDNACDDVRSPKVILHADSTLSLSNQFATEPDSQGFFYDRANVGIIDEATGQRTVIAPDGGERVYNASGGNPDDSACTNLEGGWAGPGPGWMTSTWSSTALGAASFAGQPIRLSVRNGTDGSASLVGLWFDQVTLTDVDFVGADTHSDVCTAPAQPDLRVTNITFNNNKGAQEGDKVTITATVSNVSATAAGVSSTRFVLDNQTTLGTVATGALGPNASVQVSIPWDTRSVKGQHAIAVTADSAGVVSESNETNNTSQLTVTVQGNKVKNGSFEQPNSAGNGPDNWSGSSTGAGSATWSDGGSEGSKSAATSGNGGNAVLSGAPSWTSDPVAVTPGEVLTFAVSIQATGASSAATAGLVYLGAAGNVLSTVNLVTAPLTTSGFTKLQQSVTIPGNVSSVRVKLTGFAPTDTRTAGTVKFDGVGLFGN